MANKYLKNAAGQIAEQEATVVSAGAGDAGEIVALDGAGKIDVSVLPVGVGPEVATVTASEALSAGDYVNIWNSAGSFRVRKADAATAKEAHGFVLAAVANGAVATVYLEGTNTQVAGQTPGRVYLGDTGAGAAAPATDPGELVQVIGTAVSATAVNFEPQQSILLA